MSSSNPTSRRNLLKKSFVAAAVLSSGLTEVRAANPQSGLPRSARNDMIRNPQSQTLGVNGMPMGRIKNLKISRLISGGNLISGWSHSRDLIYVHNLMDHYNTPEKVIETLAALEENGVNTIIADPRKKPMDIFKKYWSQGGKIQWIAEGHPTPEDLKTNVKASVDWGASAVYL